MEHWQQIAMRTDPWSSIPFASSSSGLNIDAQVGIVCIAAAVIVWFFAG